MKYAKYLDHVSLTMFYPIILKQFYMLTDHLMKERKLDSAKLALKKYDEVMPNLVPTTNVLVSKYYMIEAAYKLGETALANKWATQIDDYMVNLLDYDNTILQKGTTEGIDARDATLCLQIINSMAMLTKDSHQDVLNKKFEAQVKDYSGKLGSILINRAPNQ